MVVVTSLPMAMSSTTAVMFTVFLQLLRLKIGILLCEL